MFFLNTLISLDNDTIARYNFINFFLSFLKDLFSFFSSFLMIGFLKWVSALLKSNIDVEILLY